MTAAQKWKAWAEDIEPKPASAICNRSCLEVLTKNSASVAVEAFGGIRWTFDDGSKLSINPVQYWVHK